MNIVLTYRVWTSFLCESSSYCVDYTLKPSFKWGILILTLCFYCLMSPTVFSTSILFSFMVLITCYVFHELLQMSLLDQFFYFFLRDNAIFSIMTSDSVTWASATRWCGLFIAYWALKHVISITNESMEFLNNQVYQWSVAPFNIIGNTRHMIALSFMDRLIHLCDECVDMLFWVRESIVMMDGQHLPSRWELCLHNLVNERMKLSVNICCSLDWLCDKGVPSHHIASVAS